MTPGIHSISRADYDRLSSFTNWSRLKLLEKSPAHYLEETLHPSPNTDPRKLGRCTHTAALEPDKYLERYAVWDGRRAGKEWEKFLEQHESFGREVITQGMDEEAKLIAKAVRSDARALKYLQGGQGERTLIWDYTVNPVGALPGWTVRCKGRPDFLSMAEVIVDLKTTRDASPAGFAREVMRYSYHAQAAFYVDGHAAITGKRWPYVIVAVESKPPYPVTVFRVPDEILQMGREKYRALLDTLHHCQETSQWPAYATEELDLATPEWMDPDGDPTDLGLEIGASNG